MVTFPRYAFGRPHSWASINRLLFFKWKLIKVSRRNQCSLQGKSRNPHFLSDITSNWWLTKSCRLIGKAVRGWSPADGSVLIVALSQVIKWLEIEGYIAESHIPSPPSPSPTFQLKPQHFPKGDSLDEEADALSTTGFIALIKFSCAVWGTWVHTQSSSLLT